jgi:hypothetical protein
LVAKFISLPLNASKDSEALGGKVAFIEALVGLCRQQESQWYLGEHDHQVKPMDLDRRTPIGTALAVQSKRRRVRLDDTKGEPGAVQQHKEPVGPMAGAGAQVFQDHVCLLCGKVFERKFILNRHLDIHVKAGRFADLFQCRVAGCTKWLKGVTHYKNHCATAHHVFH